MNSNLHPDRQSTVNRLRGNRHSVRRRPLAVLGAARLRRPARLRVEGGAHRWLHTESLKLPVLETGTDAGLEEGFLSAGYGVAKGISVFPANRLIVAIDDEDEDEDDGYVDELDDDDEEDLEDEDEEEEYEDDEDDGIIDDEDLDDDDEEDLEDEDEEE